MHELIRFRKSCNMNLKNRKKNDLEGDNRNACCEKFVEIWFINICNNFKILV